MQNYLEMRQITKRFPGVVALDHVDFACKKGEIHALVGENGAGKSTLMNILGGLLQPTEGMITIDEKSINIDSPSTSYKLGTGFVHQESNLLQNLTVTENIFLAHEIYKHGRLDKNAMKKQVEQLNARLGYALPPEALVGSLKLADRQLTEISRALISEPKILIMDEPTASLNEDEVKRLFKILRDLKKQGVGIIYISHRLEEVVELADCVSILKDGKNAGELTGAEITKDKMISLMVGRTLKDIYPDRSKCSPGEVLMEISDLLVKGSDKKVSFSVRAGEILGLGGLEGQGQREVARAIFGDVPVLSGKLKLCGRELSVKGGITKKIDEGIGYVTHDRRGEGLVLHESIRRNTALASLHSLSAALGFIPSVKEREGVARQTERLQVKAPSLECQVGTLSGGNQQKVMLSRWLMADPKVLIVDEPTKGIDIGARMSVYEILHQLTLEGIAVVMLTSDMLELIGLSDRILTFYEGGIAEEISHEQASEERIMRAASGMLQNGGGNNE